MSVKAEQVAGAILPSGTYGIAGERVQARIVLIMDRERVKDFKVEGIVGALNAFAQQILEQIMWAGEKVK